MPELNELGSEDKGCIIWREYFGGKILAGTFWREYFGGRILAGKDAAHFINFFCRKFKIPIKKLCLSINFGNRNSALEIPMEI